MERCNASKFGEKYESLFDQNELNNSYCLQNFNLTLSVDLNMINFHILELKFNLVLILQKIIFI